MLKYALIMLSWLIYLKSQDNSISYIFVYRDLTVAYLPIDIAKWLISQYCNAACHHHPYQQAYNPCQAHGYC